MKDGNIVASYSEAADMAAPNFKDSPLNMVQYAVKNGKLYLYLNVEAIMAVAAQLIRRLWILKLFFLRFCLNCWNLFR